MSARDNFAIRPDYTAHAVNATVPAERQTEYWSPRMIHMANYYQHHVYLRAGQLARRHGLKSALDIGCGPAFKLETLIAPVCKRVVGLDEQGIVDYCKERFSFAEFFPYNIETEPFPLAETFDLVICSDVIEHLVNPDKLLADIRAATTDKSIIVLSTPDRDTLRGQGCLLSPKSVHVREWNFEEFANYLASRGFAVLEHKLLPPMKFNWSKEYARQWYAQFRAGRRFESCQMIACKKN